MDTERHQQIFLTSFLHFSSQLIKFTWATLTSASVWVKLAIQSVYHVPWMGDL